MKYDLLSRSTVKLTLSEADMREHSLCAQSITRQTTEAKRSLSKMLKKLKIFSGCKPDRLLLEAFPDADGGCVLYVSALCEELENESFSESALMCSLESLSDLIQLCHTIEALNTGVRTCVYRTYKGYILAALSSRDNFLKLKRVFGEFGNIYTDSSEISAVSEYAVPICSEEACRIFAELY